MKKFREAVGQVSDLNDLQAVGLFQNGLDLVKSEKLVKKLMFNHPKSLAEVFNKAEGYIVVEEAMNSLKRPSDRMKEADTPKAEGDQKKVGGITIGQMAARRNTIIHGDKEIIAYLLPPTQKVNKVYTKLNTDRSVILDQIRGQPFFEPPRDNFKPGQGNARKYCGYHQAAGHDTNECCNLKDCGEEGSKRFVSSVCGRKGPSARTAEC